MMKKLILLYWVLVIWISAAVPFFEAPDAYYHFSVIQHIERTGELPPKESRPPWEQMTYHAPLYYVTAAVLISPFDTLDYRLNPHAQVGEPDAANNKNFIAHVPAPDNAVWIIRGLSMICGMMTLIGIYALIKQISQERAAILGVLVVMLNPQFLFINGVVSNDPLVMALSTLALAQMVYVYQQGITTRNISLLALLLALNALSKASGMGLYPVVALTMSYVCWRDHVPVRRVLLYGAIGLGAWLVIAGWWYWNNWVQFGDFSASSMVAEATGTRTGAIDWVGELRGMYYSFWAMFGWFNIPAPEWFYTFTAVIVALGIAGFWVSLKSIHRPLYAFLGLYVVLFVVSWWQFNQMVNGSQGRLLFPVMGIFALILGVGLARLPRLVSGGLLAILAICAVIFPLVLIAPTYAHTPALQGWTPPDGAGGYLIREPWQDEACLTAWVHPTGRNSIDVWWQPTCEIEGYWSVFIHVIDPQQERCIAGDTSYILAQVDTMPDGGNLPFPAMQPGEIYVESLSIPQVDFEDVQVQVGLYDAEGGSFIRAFVTPLEEGWLTGQCAPETMLFANLSP